ncbi:beta propeller repeat protein [Plantactinospora sonchi]|uniref:Exo-alpha-sialidase n=1 Tax=Plantactinospora sonchi TaxID=1544735 RepID=A0ABU7RMT6_9ACTN
MTGLREMFEDAAEQTPPTRMLADEVYGAGRRRWRRRRAVLAGGAAAVATSLTLVLATVLLPGGAGTPDVVADGPTPRTTASGEPPTSGTLPGDGIVQWVGAGDARRGYVAMSTCSPERQPCRKTVWQLVGSDDGGRNWSVRGAPVDVAGLAVLGPDALLAEVLDAATPGVPRLMTSRDGGRSWQAPQAGPEVPAAPPGHPVVCWPVPGADPQASVAPALRPCELHALDPEANRLSPLANRVPLVLSDLLLVRQTSGRLWAPGLDPATGRPAVAISPDAGRTWSRHVFADGPACGTGGCVAPKVTVGPGTDGYAVISTMSEQAVHRYTAVTGWQRVTAVDALPLGDSDLGSFVTADGSHVLYQDSGRTGLGYRFWAARDGAAEYRQVELDGLPPMAGPPQRTPDGFYYARDTGTGIYGSTDGWHWYPMSGR